MLGYFSRKSKGVGSGVDIMKNEPKAEAVKSIPNDVPMICTFDLEREAVELLEKNLFNCVTGSLGGVMEVPNTQRDSQHLLQAQHLIPENLHEFDISIVDLGCKNRVAYSRNEHLDLKHVGANVTYALLSQFPQHVFDFKPFGVNALRTRLEDFLSKGSILIIFSDSKNIVDYQLVKIASNGNTYDDRLNHSNMNFYNDFPKAINRKGTRVKPVESSLGLTELVLKYMQEGEYSVVFEHPEHWDYSLNKRVLNNEFVPLALNGGGEIVSYVHDVSGGTVFVFPQVSDKGSFLYELFNVHLAQHFPKIFPYSGQFGWLDDGSYPLPGEAELLCEKVKLQNKYQKDIEQNQKSLAAIKEDSKFLRDILTESGDKLVSAIKVYLEWLGFDSVVNMDETQHDGFEEDLQVDCGDKLLVVEVKGIGGTSTDKACSQISKIKFRRAEQRGRFDVFGLYIVNHQRYVSPVDRQNPPFTDHQVNDARLDKRGLVTTYDLYRAYFLVVGGVIKKEYVREQLFQFGVVGFHPSGMISFGQPREMYKNNTILILDIDKVSLAIGMRLVAKKGDLYSIHIIKSLRVNEVDVPEVSSGQVGVGLDKGVPNRSEILLLSDI